MLVTPTTYTTQLQLVFAIADPGAVERVAIMKIVRLAHALDARVVLLHVVPSSATTKSRRGRLLQEIANRFKTHGIKATILLTCGRSLHEALFVELRRRANALLVMGGCRGWRPLRRWMHRRCYRLIDLSPCPVPILKSNEPYPLEPRIVASIGSRRRPAHTDEVDTTVVDAAHSLATRLDGQLHIYHAIAPWSRTLHACSELRIAPTTIRNEVYAAAQEDAEAHARSLAVRHRIDPAHVHIEERDVRQSLPAFVLRHPADITVVGAPLRSWTRSQTVDSTWVDFLSAMKSDVLLVKPTASVKDWQTRELTHAAAGRSTSLEPVLH